MKLQNGATYRLENRADGRRSLNVYGNAPANLANVCLWNSDDNDICQQWVFKVVDGHRYFVCKGAPGLALDLFTGSSATANVSNFNAHVYAPTSTSYLIMESASDGNSGYCRIRLANNTAKYLTANQGSNGTGAGRDVNAAGNVYWYKGGLTDYSQDWKLVQLDGTTPAPDPEPGKLLTLANLKNKFPHGKYWNHVGMSGNNPDGYTNTPCPTHANESTCNAFELNGVKYSWQCMGFAEKCGYDFTGSNPRVNGVWTTSEVSSSLNNLKAGDIVRFYNNGYRHSILVTGVTGETVTYGDCNATGKNCQIRWDATISKETLRSQFIHLRRAPFALK